MVTSIKVVPIYTPVECVNVELVAGKYIYTLYGRIFIFPYLHNFTLPISNDMHSHHFCHLIIVEKGDTKCTT